MNSSEKSSFQKQEESKSIEKLKGLYNITVKQAHQNPQNSAFNFNAAPVKRSFLNGPTSLNSVKSNGQIEASEQMTKPKLANKSLDRHSEPLVLRKTGQTQHGNPKNTSDFIRLDESYSGNGGAGDFSMNFAAVNESIDNTFKKVREALSLDHRSSFANSHHGMESLEKKQLRISPSNKSQMEENKSSKEKRGVFTFQKEDPFFKVTSRSPKTSKWNTQSQLKPLGMGSFLKNSREIGRTQPNPFFHEKNMSKIPSSKAQSGDLSGYNQTESNEEKNKTSQSIINSKDGPSVLSYQTSSTLTKTQTFLTLPGIRKTPARKIGDKYKEFKKGIYKELYSTSEYSKSEKVQNFLRNFQPVSPNDKRQSISKRGEYDNQESNYLGTIPEQLNSHPRSHMGGNSSLNQSISAIQIKRQKTIKKEDIILDSLDEKTPLPTYLPSSDFAERVMSAFNQKNPEALFSPEEIKLLETLMPSLKKTNRALYEFLQHEFCPNGTARFKAVRTELREKFLFISRTNLSVNEAIKLKLLNSADRKPYQGEKSKEFFDAIKAEDHKKVRNMMANNKLLAFDVDYIGMTPLHWATKKNNEKICGILLDACADVNAQDQIGRIPLYFAVENQNCNLVCEFLLRKASPWSSPPDKSYEELCLKNGRIKHYIQKSRELHIIMQLSSLNFRTELWNKEASTFAMGINRKKKKSQPQKEYNSTMLFGRDDSS